MQSNVDLKLEHLSGARRIDRRPVRKRSAYDRTDESQRGVPRLGQGASLHRAESVHPGQVPGLGAKHPDMKGGRSSESPFGAIRVPGR
jgi:hypothetical protein